VNGLCMLPEKLHHDHLDDLIAAARIHLEYERAACLGPAGSRGVCVHRMTGIVPGLWKADVDSAFRSVPASPFLAARPPGRAVAAQAGADHGSTSWDGCSCVQTRREGLCEHAQLLPLWGHQLSTRLGARWPGHRGHSKIDIAPRSVGLCRRLLCCRTVGRGGLLDMASWMRPQKAISEKPPENPHPACLGPHAHVHSVLRGQIAWNMPSVAWRDSFASSWVILPSPIGSLSMACPCGCLGSKWRWTARAIRAARLLTKRRSGRRCCGWPWKQASWRQVWRKNLQASRCASV